MVGHNAAKMAVGLGAHVTIIDKNLDRLRALDDIYNSQIVTLASNTWTIRETLRLADLVVGAVLIPGAAAPKLVRRDMIKSMKRGSVVVDVAIDQGGCFETSHPTTHTDPTYVVDGVVHYCVSNMPAAGAAHVDVRSDERHISVRAATRIQRTRESLRGFPRDLRRGQYIRRTHHLRGGRGIAEPLLGAFALADVLARLVQRCP